MIIIKQNPWILMCGWNLKLLIIFISFRMFLCIYLKHVFFLILHIFNLFIYFSFTGAVCSSSLYTSIEKHSSIKSYTEYSCIICKYSSCYLFNIKRHVRLHTGDLPYRCNICNKRFNEKRNLKSHLMFIHEEEMF